MQKCVSLKAKTYSVKAHEKSRICFRPFKAHAIAICFCAPGLPCAPSFPAGFQEAPPHDQDREDVTSLGCLILRGYLTAKMSR